MRFSLIFALASAALAAQAAPLDDAPNPVTRQAPCPTGYKPVPGLPGVCVPLNSKRATEVEASQAPCPAGYKPVAGLPGVCVPQNS